MLNGAVDNGNCITWLYNVNVPVLLKDLEGHIVCQKGDNNHGSNLNKTLLSYYRLYFPYTVQCSPNLIP